MDNIDPFAPPWEDWAKQYGYSKRATFKDELQFDLEVETILKQLAPKGGRLFDVGCGNGATLKKLIDVGLQPEKIGGSDILPEFVELAKKSLPEGDFSVMDISQDSPQTWDVLKRFSPSAIIIKRVLCNLSGRKNQRKALINVCKSLPLGCKSSSLNR